MGKTFQSPKVVLIIIVIIIIAFLYRSAFGHTIVQKGRMTFRDNGLAIIIIIIIIVIGFGWDIEIL